ncbi:MAG: hypothetical protein SFT92_01380 [Rickettsiales bacterium]|nr:hypothetical protein [Rickettsiales bacterium]
MRHLFISISLVFSLFSAAYAQTMQPLTASTAQSTTTATTTSTTTVTEQTATKRAAYPDGKTMVEGSLSRAGNDARTNVKDKSLSLANKVKNDIYEGSEKFYQWVLEPPPPPKPHLPVPTSYCYRSFQDVMCYRQPMPGWEHRLVGYQGTGAAEPPPAVTKLLPVMREDASILPEKRLANAKPVFKDIPQDNKAKEEDASVDGSLIPDPANQALPSAATSPQL